MLIRLKATEIGNPFSAITITCVDHNTSVFKFHFYWQEERNQGPIKEIFRQRESETEN